MMRYTTAFFIVLMLLASQVAKAQVLDVSAVEVVRYFNDVKLSKQFKISQNTPGINANISGVVYQPISGDTGYLSLTGAKLILTNSTGKVIEEIISSAQGKFEFKPVPKGKYSLIGEYSNGDKSSFGSVDLDFTALENVQATTVELQELNLLLSEDGLYILEESQPLPQPSPAPAPAACGGSGAGLASGGAGGGLGFLGAALGAAGLATGIASIADNNNTIPVSSGTRPSR